MRDSLKVLVTGGAGFIGSHLVDRFVSDNWKVRVIDDLSTGKFENIARHVETGSVEFVEGDIRDCSIVRKCVEGVSVVAHLAAITSVPFSVEHPDVTFDVNVRGTANLLSEAASAGVGRFVFVSSCAVYGDPQSLPVHEGQATNPVSPYAESKLRCEAACSSFHQQGLLGSVVLRLFNVYGPRQGVSEYSGVITRFIDGCRKGLPLVVYGDGLQTRDFVNVHDVVDAFLAAAERENVNGEVFNVGSGKPTSIRELAEVILELAGVDLEIRHEEPRAGDIKESYADISKAQALLGFKPVFSLKDGLRALLSESVVPKSC